MFSVVDGLFLRNLTYPDLRQLVTLWRYHPAAGGPVPVTLLAASGFTLLVTSVSVASLLVARASVRPGEMAIRSAVGAPRGRLARQLLTESLVLAAISGVAGLVVSLWGIDLLLALLPSYRSSLDAVALDVRLLAIACVVTLVTGVASGIFPAAFVSHRATRPQPMNVQRSE